MTPAVRKLVCGYLKGADLCARYDIDEARHHASFGSVTPETKEGVANLRIARRELRKLLEQVRSGE